MFNETKTHLFHEPPYNVRCTLQQKHFQSIYNLLRHCYDSISIPSQSLTSMTHRTNIPQKMSRLLRKITYTFLMFFLCVFFFFNYENLRIICIRLKKRGKKSHQFHPSVSNGENG